ncbi:MAG: type II toxin-antitoxin system HicA family toxin [Desulfovibrio sp.]|nr:type II toxin-antitoxin system HicA family toxin [Desulfovibrio sp.]
MNNKQKKTLVALFGSPPPRDMPWEDLESLLKAAGAVMTEGDGSRVKFDMNGVTVAFHRPHKPKTVRSYQVQIACEFLECIGVKP